MLLPGLVAIVAPVGEQVAATLVWVGLGWGLLLFALSWFLLFDGRGFELGSADNDGGDPGPEDNPAWPTPPGPIGGIPLPDAELSATRALRPSPPTAVRPSASAASRAGAPCAACLAGPDLAVAASHVRAPPGSRSGCPDHRPPC